MRRTFQVSALACLLIAAMTAWVPLAPAQDEDAPTITAVFDGSFMFEPSDATIEVGTTVTWVNGEQGAFHTITSTDSLDDKSPNGMFDGDIDGEGDTFTHTFDSVGEFHYYCEPHATTMFGTITVTAAGGSDNTQETGSDQTQGSGDASESSPDSGRSPGLGVVVVLAAGALVAAVAARRRGL